MLAFAPLLLALSTIAGGPRAVDKTTAVRATTVKIAPADVDLTVAAMGARRPKLTGDHAVRFEAVLAAARGTDRAAVDAAWDAFAAAYFSKKTEMNRRALELVVIAEALRHHTPKTAAAAAEAAKTVRTQAVLTRRIAVLTESKKRAEAKGEATGTLTDQLMNATKQMQELNQSFNMQYLQLQQKIQQETREFNLMSNIMKTKHDTAKNAIGNVR